MAEITVMTNWTDEVEFSAENCSVCRRGWLSALQEYHGKGNFVKFKIMYSKVVSEGQKYNIKYLNQE